MRGVEGTLIEQVLHDRYLIRSLLGRQTGRRTFLATDLQTESLVVVKLMLFGVDFVWDDLKLFERETQVLQSLEHPAIPKYLDWFDIETELGKGFALVQTYLEARSLQEWVLSGRTFSEAELKTIAQQLLAVLDYLHCGNPSVVHRDIKPSNILLSDRSGHHPGQVYLIDFGSVQVGRQDGTRTIVGTYGYMPLEQFGGQTTPISDLYALGATLIYLATGEHPADLPQQDMRIVFEHCVNMSPPIVDWLKWSTEPNADRRLQSAKQALEVLNNPDSSQNRSIVLAQPVNSRVKVIQTQPIFEMLILPQGIDFSGVSIMIFSSCFVIVGLLSFLGLCRMVGTPWELILFISAIALVPITVTGGWMLWTSLFNAFGQVRLRLTESEIFLSSEMFRWQYRSALIAQRHNISKVELTLGVYREVPGSYQAHAYTKFIMPQINIWMGAKSIPIGSGLTLPELEWLAQEISTLLNLPISRNEMP
jgi:serine/threonine protein kinase